MVMLYNGLNKIVTRKYELTYYQSLNDIHLRTIIVEEMRYEIYVISTNVLQKMNILAIMQRLL